MKKVILASLCVLLVAAGTPAFGYTVSGRVLDGSSNNGVSGATVYINCYASSSGVTVTSGNNGFYQSGEFTAYKDQTIVVKAVKGSQSGSTSWAASNSIGEIGKDVSIYYTLIATGEVHCEPQPVPMSEPATEPAPVFLYVQLASGPVLVNGGTVDMHYETETMSCSTVSPMPPFDTSFYYSIEPIGGTIHVEASAPPGLYVPVDNGENPTPFLTLILEPRDFNTPGKISNVTVTSSEIATDTGIISAFPSRTEYVIGEPNAGCNPYRRIAEEHEWQEALSSGHVYAMEPEDWESYMYQWQEFVVEGEPYPNDPFLPAMPPTGDLYVYGGGGGGALDPCDAGLVMYWGDATTPDGGYSSAWKFDYLKDPDLRNCIITVAVTAPNNINQVSFGLQNPPVPGGLIRAWYWNCGAAGSGAPIIWSTPTVITIDTSKTGVGAATPTASAYMNNPGFALNNVQWLIVDEDANWVGSAPAPPPGSGMIGMWNYWHWLMISPKTTLSKDFYKKWSQPPVIIDPNVTPPVILGWDERSLFGDTTPHVVADDWECKDNRPITDIHWWGSFIGWNESYPPPVVPKAFHIGIWTDVPDPDPCDPLTFSHPGRLVWENYCDNFVWNFAGYDKDPRMYHDPCMPFEPEETCFQFNQLLSQDEWFYQEPSDDPCNPRIYWLSIAPIWGGATPPYEWGWKTRPHYFKDDAVVITDVDFWPPTVGGTKWTGGYPIKWPPYPDPEGITWDVAFELTTNEPAYEDNPIPGDLNADKIVNFYDVAILANNWLVAAP
jgi:hypothetical protein